MSNESEVILVLALIGAGTVLEVALIKAYMLRRLYKDLFKR